MALSGTSTRSRSGRGNDAAERRRAASHERNYSVKHDQAAEALAFQLDDAGIQHLHHIDHSNSGTIDYGVRYYTIGVLGLLYSLEKLRKDASRCDADNLFNNRVVRFAFEREAIGFPERFASHGSPMANTWKVRGLIPVSIVVAMCKEIDGIKFWNVMPYEGPGDDHLAYSTFELRDHIVLTRFAARIREHHLDYVPFTIS